MYVWMDGPSLAGTLAGQGWLAAWLDGWLLGCWLLAGWLAVRGTREGKMALAIAMISLVIAAVEGAAQPQLWFVDKERGSDDEAVGGRL